MTTKLAATHHAEKPAHVERAYASTSAIHRSTSGDLSYHFEESASDIRVYEFGCRIDRDCVAAVNEQFAKANRLYNVLVEAIRRVTDEARAFVLDRAGTEAQELARQVENLSEQFATARAANDEAQMKEIAHLRRTARTSLFVMLTAARKEHKADLVARFWSRIGNKIGTDTYALRCAAVADGLGWATANATLAAALLAQKSSSKTGGVPAFRRSAELTQESLTLQMTAPGGVPFANFLGERHTEFKLTPIKAARRAYTSFAYRLGAADKSVYATGTLQYHRSVPLDGAVKLIRLTRKRLGPDTRYFVQLTVGVESATSTQNRRLVALHFGWHADAGGSRVIAGQAEDADPGLASLITFPQHILEQLEQAEGISSQRDLALNEAWEPIRDELRVLSEDDRMPEGLRDTAKSLSVLPLRRVAPRRLHWLWRQIIAAQADGIETPDLRAFLEWRVEDKRRWQSEVHGMRRARNARRTHYKQLAADLAMRFGAVAISAPNLKEAAVVIDEASGDRTELAKSARRARTRLALSECIGSIKAAFSRAGGVVLNVDGKTVSTCAFCGGECVPDASESQLLNCVSCHAQIERKRNGASVAWQLVMNDGLEEVLDEAISSRASSREDKTKAAIMKKSKMADGRRLARAARTSSDADFPQGSRSVESNG